MKFRHEWKHEIDFLDVIVLRNRLKAIMSNDIHAKNGKYLVRSLYFDNLQDKALLEKINGVNKREKFRLRYYNDSINHVSLEKKSKINGLCCKEQVKLSDEQVKAILNGDEINSKSELLNEFMFKTKSQGLKPKTIVDYVREPFVYPAGNVRVTLDYEIRTGLNSTDFLNPDRVTIPANTGAVLEVKWDEFLPAMIRDIVQLHGKRTTAFSKYAACRIYG